MFRCRGRARFKRRKDVGGQRLQGDGSEASGNQVTVTSQCAVGSNTGTTTYHGDSFDSENSNGTKVHAKRIGACP